MMRFSVPVAHWNKSRWQGQRDFQTRRFSAPKTRTLRRRSRANEQLGARCSRNELSHPDILRKYLFAAAIVSAIAAPAIADEVGVGVQAGPVGGGVTVGESHEHRPVDRDRTTVIKEHEPLENDRTAVIKKENEDGSREKAVIH